MSRLNSLTGLFLAIATVGAAPAPSDYEITSLPGLNATLGFKQYSGMMPINDGHGTELFFWFVESQDAPSTDPVVLWMNGGPGSSSLAYGFWTEHGPFRLVEKADGSAAPELYSQSWNQHANVLYLEAPTGVGFSFSTDAAKYKNITDEDSSTDNFNFLLSWFECFDTFKANDFFITAESYGGHYGPTLAEQLIDHDNAINMKGLLIGNPGINSDWYYNVNEFAFVTFMYSHALIPSPAYLAAKDACGWDTFLSDCAKDFTHPTPACLAATTAALKYVPSPLDPYNVLAKTCQAKAGHMLGAEADAEVVAYTPFLGEMRRRHGLDLEYNPCISRWTAGYVNRPDVLKAIHADGHYSKLRQWPKHPIGWSYNEGPAGAKKDIALLFPKFFEKRPQWKIAVVSGDADAAVPFLGTERWMECLGRPIAKDWRAWKMDGDVAGMIKDWDHFSLVTVKGCGHTIRKLRARTHARCLSVLHPLTLPPPNPTPPHPPPPGSQQPTALRLATLSLPTGSAAIGAMARARRSCKEAVAAAVQQQQQQQQPQPQPQRPHPHRGHSPRYMYV
jgi:serine carboxypeptidase-like clade 2